jgi:hypothetical protein
MTLPSNRLFTLLILFTRARSYLLPQCLHFAQLFSSSVVGPSLTISTISIPFDRSSCSNSSTLSRFHRRIFLRVSETPVSPYLARVDPEGRETYSTRPFLVRYDALWVALPMPNRIGSRIFLIMDSSSSPRTRNVLRILLISPIS